MHLLPNASFLGIEGQIARGVHKIVAHHPHLAVFNGQPHRVDCRVLDLHRFFPGNLLAHGHHYLAGGGVNDVLRSRKARDPGGDGKLLVEFIAPNPGQVITLGVEEQAAQQRAGALHVGGLAGTHALINLQQALVLALGIVLFDGYQQPLVLAQQLADLGVGAVADRPQDYGHGQLTGAVHLHPHDLVAVGFVFQPSAAVRDHRGGIEMQAVLIDRLGVVHARGTHQLGNDDAFGAVDDKGTLFRHQREVAHENVLFLHLAGFPVGQPHAHL